MLTSTQETQRHHVTTMDPIISTLRSILNESDSQLYHSNKKTFPHNNSNMNKNKKIKIQSDYNNNNNGQALSPISSFHDESSPPSSPQHQELFLSSTPMSSPIFSPMPRCEYSYQPVQHQENPITGEAFLKFPIPRPPAPPLGSAPFPPSMRQRRPVTQSKTSAFNTSNVWRQSKTARKLPIHNTNTNRASFHPNSVNSSPSSTTTTTLPPTPLPPPSPFTVFTGASNHVSMNEPLPSSAGAMNDKNSYIARSQFCYPLPPSSLSSPSPSPSPSLPSPVPPVPPPRSLSQTESVLPLLKYHPLPNNFCPPPSPPLPPSSILSTSSVSPPLSLPSSSTSSLSPSIISMSSASPLSQSESAGEAQPTKSLFEDSSYVSNIFQKIEKEGQLQTQIFPGYISPQQYPPNMRKRKRTERLCAGQTKVLELVFSRDPMPNKRTKELLAEELGISVTRVQVWFQNRRAKQRKEYWSTQTNAN